MLAVSSALGLRLNQLVLAQGVEAVAAEIHPLEAMIFRAHELNFFVKTGAPTHAKRQAKLTGPTIFLSLVRYCTCVPRKANPRLFGF